MAAIGDIKRFYGFIKEYSYQRNWKDAPGLKDWGFFLWATCLVLAGGIAGAATLSTGGV